MRFSQLRRTNQLVHYPTLKMSVKRYRDTPLSVVGQVACGIRSSYALNGEYRWKTEKRKSSIAAAFGIPLPFEYYRFYERNAGGHGMPFAVVEYKPSLVTAEDKIRSGIPPNEVFEIVRKCSSALSDFHRASVGKRRRLTHGDPYLENFDISGMSAVLFDLEQEHPGDDAEAIARDQLVFFWHTVNVVRESGNLCGRQDFERLLDTVHAGYPGLEISMDGMGRLQRLYFRLRFVNGENKEK